MANTIKIKRGSGSDPAASDMVLGEPVLRTDTAELFFKKDDGSVAKVSGGGGGPDFKYLALRNAANNGAASYPANDFTLVTSGTTNAITPAAANTLLVSVNGVIQKPNAGTSTSGITGFIVDGSRFKTATNLTQAPDFILYQESGGIGEPSDNTVSEAKLKVSNSPVNGYFLSAQSGNTGGLTWAAPVATSCTGNSATATALATARTINGTSFDGTANITVTAAAGTLTGNTLNSSVVTSSLTSLGDLAGLTVDGDMALTGANYNVLWDKSDNALEFADNAKAVFGTSNEFEIFHDGTNSIIKESTSNGSLKILGQSILFKNTNDNEVFIDCHLNGSVDLYYDNVKKFETTSYGAKFTDNVLFNNPDTAGRNLTWEADNDALHWEDNTKATFGASNDLQIYHDGSHSRISDVGTGKLILETDGSEIQLNKGTTENMIKCFTDGAVELYYDGSKKFETTANGVVVTNTPNNHGLELMGSGNNTCIKFRSTGSSPAHAYRINFHSVTNNIFNSPCLSFDKTDTSGNFDSHIGAISDDGFHLKDSKKLHLGGSGASGDLQIYHDGNHSYIEDAGTGNLIMKSNVFRLRSTGDEEMIIANENGNVKLYHNNVKKFETTSDGGQFTGTNLVLDTGTGSSSEFIIKKKGSYAETCGIGFAQGSTTYGNNAINFRSMNNSGNVISQIKIQTGTADANQSLFFADNSTIKIGDSADLEIFHDGSDSFIKDTGTGALKICSSLFRVNNAANNEAMIKAEQDAGVTLSFNGNTSCETTADGLKVKDGTGSVAALEVVATGTNRSDMRILATGSGDAHLWLDASNGDLQGGDYATIYHSNTSGNLNLVNYANDMEFYVRGGSVGAGGLRKAAHFNNNGTVDLYHNGNHMVSTASDGIQLQTDKRFSRPPNSNSTILQVTNAQYAKSLYIGGWDSGTNSSGISRIRNSNDNLHLDSGSAGQIYLNAYSSGRIRTRHISPMSDNTFDLGQSDIRFDDVFATNGTIQTSDKTKKNTIVDSDLGLSFINKLKPVSYKFNDGTRTHYGLIAQDVETVLSDISKTTTNFAGFIKTDIPDEYYEEAEPNIPDGKKEGDLKSAAHSEYGLRYSEFISPLIKAIQELTAKVEALEGK